MSVIRRFISSLLLLSFLVVCLLWIALPYTTAQDGDAGGSCPGSLPPRLIVGEAGRVLPGEPNNVRLEPTTSARRIGQIKAGESFTVEDGPICADGYTWWQVNIRGLVGWTPESGDGVYWLETIALSVTIAQDDCPGALPTRFSIGDQVQVRPEKANNVRVTPSTSAKITHKIAVGSSVILINGPVCADGYTWWQIEDQGWTAESGDGVYWLEEFNTVPVVLSPIATATQNAALTLLTPTATQTPNAAVLGGELSFMWRDDFDDNSSGWNEVPFDGDRSGEFLFREIKKSSYYMERTHFSGFEQDSDVLSLSQILDVDSLDTFVFEIDVQSLALESQSQCVMIKINLDVTDNAMLLFCRQGLMTVISFADRDAQDPQGYVMTGIPDPMDGATHRLTVTSDGTTLHLYVDGQGGLAFPYNRSLNSIGLGYYDVDQSSTLTLGVRFDALMLGVPAASGAPVQPHAQATAKATTAAILPGPHATSSAEAVFMYDPPANVVPKVFDLLRIVPIWQETFDNNDANWNLLTGPNATHTREIKDGVYEMASTSDKDGLQNSDLMQWIYRDGRSSLDQYAVFMDVQTLSPQLDTQCIMMTLNPLRKDARLTAYFCSSGTVSVVGSQHEEQPSIVNGKANLSVDEFMMDLPNAMDGNVHRLGVVVDGLHARFYIDGRGGVEHTYGYEWDAIAIGYLDLDQQNVTQPRVRFDNLEMGIPTGCTLMLTTTVQDLVVAQQGETSPSEDPNVMLYYGSSQDWTYDVYTGNSATLINQPLAAGDRVTGFAPLSYTVGCLRRTTASFTLYEGDEFVDQFTVNLDENAWKDEPITSTVTFSSLQGRTYTLTYTIGLHESDGTSLPLAQDVSSNMTIEHGR